MYLKRLSDIELLILEQIVRQSCDYAKSHDGEMHRAVERSLAKNRLKPGDGVAKGFEVRVDSDAA